jgi:hypothetical protein
VGATQPRSLLAGVSELAGRLRDESSRSLAAGKISGIRENFKPQAEFRNGLSLEQAERFGDNRAQILLFGLHVLRVIKHRQPQLRKWMLEPIHMVIHLLGLLAISSVGFKKCRYLLETHRWRCGNSQKRKTGSLAAPRLLLSWLPRCRRRRWRRAPQERCEIGVYLKLLCPVESYKIPPCTTSTIPFYSRVSLNATGKSGKKSRAERVQKVATPAQPVTRSHPLNTWNGTAGRAGLQPRRKAARRKGLWHLKPRFFVATEYLRNRF